MEEGNIAVIDSKNNCEIHHPNNTEISMARRPVCLEEDISPYGLSHRSFFIGH